MHINLAFWLIPSLADRVFYQEIIDTLAQEYDAPTFIPHITIYFGQYAPDTSASKLIAESTQGLQSLTLQIERILYTEEFTKTVFVQFHPNTILEQLSEYFRNSSSHPSTFILNPHLSLIYKQMSEQTKKSIVDTLSLPKLQVDFNEIIAIASPEKIRGREDIESLEIVATQKII